MKGNKSKQWLIEQKEWKNMLSKIKPYKFNSKTMFKGIVYNNDTFCSDHECFYNKYDKFEEDSLNSILIASEMTANKKENKCVSCGKNFQSAGHKK